MAYHDLLAYDIAVLLEEPEAVILDMRDPASFANGHLPGAQLSDDSVVKALVRKRRQDPPVLIYCYHGHNSRELASFLSGLGFSRVYNLEGGWQAWEAAQASKAVTLSEELRSWAAGFGFDADDLNGRIENGMSMLMIAAVEGRHDLAVELLRAGADPNLLNDDENNALWFACYSEHLELLGDLIAHGVELNHQNSNGATSLIYAASAGKFEVVKALLDAGADPRRSTLDGFNALDSAATLPVLKCLRPHFATA